MAKNENNKKVNNKTVKKTNNTKRTNNGIKKQSINSKSKTRNTSIKNTNSKRSVKPKKVEKMPFKVIPLGGLKEIGKNCTAIECGDEILLIDCGFAFPEYEMFGIDIVLPDFTYLKENMEKIKGLIITHGHEDHIGGVPYLLQEIRVPIYASAFAMGLINHKFEEFGLNAEEHIVKNGSKVNIGKFKVEAIQVNHSIADSLGYSIKFGGNHIIHTGDFKIDYSPLDGKVIDLNRLSRLGDEGVDLLLCDSTNVLREGYTPSEARVRKSIDEIFDNNVDKRIIIATFSSNVHRLMYFAEAAMKHHRKVAVSGKSMENVLNLARELGYLNNVPESIFVEIKDLKNLPDKQVTILTTGSQGEPMSALTRMAFDGHKGIKLKKGDVVVYSSSPIPGNEKVVTQVVNQLYEKKVDVVLASSMDVHVSGHASKEELKLIHTLVRPKFFLPAHGEYRHLIEHAKLAKSLGQASNHIFIMSNGDALTIDGNKGKVTEKYTSGEDVMVDGSGIGDVGSVVLRERKTLSQSGLMVIAVAIDQATGSLMSEPSLFSKGFVYVQDNLDLIAEAKNVVYNTLGSCIDKNAFDEQSLIKAIKSDMKAYIYKKTKRNPVILPMILYV